MTGNRLITVPIALLAIAAITVIVLIAIGADRLWSLIGGVFVLGVIGVALAAIGVNLYSRMSASRAEREALLYNHAEAMAKAGLMVNDRRALVYTPMSLAKQIAAPAAPQPEQVDPRYALLVNLCLLTIKSATYGPTSKRLMSADDAQAERSGQFADRENWSKASRYGQEIGILYTQVGGPPQEQGLKIKGDNTVADLLVSLHERNLILDSAVSALPAMSR